MKRICLIIPSLSAGGMERVMTELASTFSQVPSIQVTLVVLTKGERFYSPAQNVEIIEPEFLHSNNFRLLLMCRTFLFLRRTVRRLRPDAILSFGGKYNAFVLLSTLGLCSRTFVSDRSRPGISYGAFLNLINPVVYRLAAGIIAQTERARVFHLQTARHKNIRVIGNPVLQVTSKEDLRENIILNVGRFIPSKRQRLLLEYFAQIGNGSWRLVFVGDGRCLQECLIRSRQLGIEDHVDFVGNQRDVERYYMRSRIFAFTSESEGFPNALAEAMSAGLACISFNCVAGPSDLINDGENGFLVDMGADQDYVDKLAILMRDRAVRESFGARASAKMRGLSCGEIGAQFLDFIFGK